MAKTKRKSALPLGAACVGEVAVVTIPLAEYEDLLKLRQLYGAAAGSKTLPPPMRSPIERDRQLCAFLDERLGKMYIYEIAAEAKQRFGDKAPSKSAIHRYHMRRLPRKIA